MGYKNEILKLREDGLSYNQIEEKLGCSKATISYHCKKWSLNDIGLSKSQHKISKKKEINEYYKTHTKKETAAYFNISESSVRKYCEKKKEKLTDLEKRKRKYLYVLNFRQKIKEKAIKYKGGKCMICGYDKSNWSLDFHHRDPNEKDFGIASSNILKWDLLKIELDKCDLLCKNCHGELHEKLNLSKTS